MAVACHQGDGQMHETQVAIPVSRCRKQRETLDASLMWEREPNEVEELEAASL